MDSFFNWITGQSRINQECLKTADTLWKEMANDINVVGRAFGKTFLDNVEAYFRSEWLTAMHNVADLVVNRLNPETNYEKTFRFKDDVEITFEIRFGSHLCSESNSLERFKDIRVRKVCLVQENGSETRKTYYAYHHYNVCSRFTVKVKNPKVYERPVVPGEKEVVTAQVVE